MNKRLYLVYIVVWWKPPGKCPILNQYFKCFYQYKGSLKACRKCYNIFREIYIIHTF